MDMLLKRFEREAKSTAGLSHPNIVPVIDYGEFEGAPYLVMIYLPGGTLKEPARETHPLAGWRYKKSCPLRRPSNMCMTAISSTGM